MDRWRTSLFDRFGAHARDGQEVALDTRKSIAPLALIDRSLKRTKLMPVMRRKRDASDAGAAAPLRSISVGLACAAAVAALLVFVSAMSMTPAAEIDRVDARFEI